MAKEEQKKETVKPKPAVAKDNTKSTNQSSYKKVGNGNKEQNGAKSEAPYQVFQNSIKRALNLLDIDKCDDGNKFSIHTNTLNDAYRAAIVLSISALDGYLGAFVIRRIKVLLRNRDNIPSALTEYIKRLFNKDEFYKIALRPDFNDELENRFERNLEKRSFQGQENISFFMKIVGYDDIFKEISNKADVSPDNLRKNIEMYTQRRHIIAHRGDYDLSQTKPTENPIKKRYTKQCIELVEFIAVQIHNLSKEK